MTQDLVIEGGGPFPLRKEESYWKGKHFRLGDGSLR